MAGSGYSGTPLAKKLGFKPGWRAAALDCPMDYRDLVSSLPEGVDIGSKVSGATDPVHVFDTREASLGRTLKTLRAKLKPDGVVWVSWPKKTSGAPTDLTEDRIRALALPLGFVDVKVCAVDQTWSGLKLVIRKALR